MTDTNDKSEENKEPDQKVEDVHEIKSKVYTEDPYSYNYIALKKDETKISPTQSAEQMITDPVYNMIGKFLGVDTVHDWNRYYDKVYTITEWAKVKSGLNDREDIAHWLGDQSRILPDIGTKSLDNLYLFARLYFSKK